MHAQSHPRLHRLGAQHAQRRTWHSLVHRQLPCAPQNAARPVHLHLHRLDGADDKVGFTVPSSAGQVRTIAAAMRSVGVAPELIRYVELHGSGTSMEDALEASSLVRALGSATA